jgi:glutathione peroxidase
MTIWNFDKFLVASDGPVATRFTPQTEPHDAGLTAAVEKLLPR